MLSVKWVGSVEKKTPSIICCSVRFIFSFILGALLVVLISRVLNGIQQSPGGGGEFSSVGNDADADAATFRPSTLFHGTADVYLFPHET